MVLFTPDSSLCAAPKSQSTRVELHLAEQSVPPAFAPERVHAVMADVARIWNRAAAACSSVEIALAKPLRARLAKQDGRSIVVFRRESWCHNERCGERRTYPLSVAAMTTVYPSSPTLEGDVELNAVSFDWGSMPQPERYLRAVLAHEVGHVLGFADVCATAHGRPISGACDEGDSIMFAPARLEIPSAADVAELCRRFPRSSARAPAGVVTDRSGAVLSVAAALSFALLAAQLLLTSRRRVLK